MPFHQAGSLGYFTFNALAAAGVEHAIFTRLGGVSPGPWQELNVGGTVGDDPQRVAENRRLSFTAVNRPTDSLYDVWQVHGREVVCANAPRPTDRPHLKADAILTDRPNVTLFMRFADCVPVFLYDPKRNVVGLVHAGWQGTVKRVCEAAIRQLEQNYGSRPGDVYAAIGPSIGPDHYEIGPDVGEQVASAFGSQASELMIVSEKAPGTIKLDLWNANRVVLEQAGVGQVEIAGLCTACDLENWYSHRAEHGKTGRFGALIACKSAG
jgi:YfiH family protein